MTRVRSPGDFPQEPGHELKRPMGLRDLVLAQILTVVGSSWVGIAAGVGAAQFGVWLLAFAFFYAPMAVAVYHLNRAMPLEGGLYVWARRSFGDEVGFMTAWNIWAYALSSIATVLFQIPSELAYLLGPAAAGLPEDRRLVDALLALVIALLIVAPLWAWWHGAHLAYAPFALHLPPGDPRSLSLVGQVLFAAAGLEYVAIMAGETRGAERAIGRSVVIASPIILLMFVLGTASVVSLHGAHPRTAINYIAPIPQTLTLAFGEHGPAALLGKAAIVLLQIRILGAASFLYTGATRLPMTAGWDHLIPAWFVKLHPRYQTPVNSILLTSAVIVAMLALGTAGVRAAVAFGLLNDASSEFYALAYLVMFLIPICGDPLLRRMLPRTVAWICGAGVVTIQFIVALNAYPFVDAVRPGVFAAKVLGTTLLVNAVGWLFYRARRARGAPAFGDASS